MSDKKEPQELAVSGGAVDADDAWGELPEDLEKEVAEEEQQKNKDTVIGMQSHADGSTTPIHAAQWRPKPYVRNQIEDYPDQCQIASLKSFVLDLSNKNDLDTLNKYDTKCLDADTGHQIYNRRIEFHDGKYIALLTVAFYEFKPIIK